MHIFKLEKAAVVISLCLTTMTTFVGLVPIMLERSTDAQFLKPAVIALAFSVLFALFVTIFLVPSLYCIGDDIKSAGRRFSTFIRLQLGLKVNAPEPQ